MTTEPALNNEYRFIRVYKALAKQYARESEVTDLYWRLQDAIGNEDKVFCKSCGKDHNIGAKFEKAMPDPITASIAIDAVAHAIHQSDDDIFLRKIFPSADLTMMKQALDDLAGLEKTNEIRKANRGYFTTLMADTGITFLEKQQVGRTTKEDILPHIVEYKKLFGAGFASPAEILTLHRFYPDNETYSNAVVEKGLLDNPPTVVGGPASVEEIDREGHLITAKALEAAFKKFMSNFRARNSQIIHSDVQVGWILPCYIASNGSIFKSGTDDKQLWVITELRNDMKVAQKVIDDIQDGKLKSYSIAGSATKTKDIKKGLNDFMQVDGLEIYEITLCLSENVKIWTKRGLVGVKDIVVGDEVWTHNNRWKPVVHTMSRQVDEELLRIHTADGKTIEITKNHPVRVWAFGGGMWGLRYDWILAEYLTVGEKVVSKIAGFAGNKLLKIVKIERFHHSGPVYNMEVDKDHSYTTEAMVVSNCERGMNPGAMFELLKSSINSTNPEILANLLKSFPDQDMDLPEFQIFVEKSDNPKVVIKADKPNSLTESLALSLQKSLPQGIPVVVYDGSLATTPQIPVYKMRLVPVWKQEQAKSVKPKEKPKKIEKQEQLPPTVEGLKKWVAKSKRGGQ